MLRSGPGKLKKLDKANRTLPTLIFFGSIVLIPALRPAHAQMTPQSLPSAHISAERMRRYSDLSVEWMQQYLRVDTTNPPGNEMRAAQFFKRILDQEGIENQVFEYTPGRARTWSR